MIVIYIRFWKGRSGGQRDIHRSGKFKAKEQME